MKSEIEHSSDTKEDSAEAPLDNPFPPGYGEDLLD